VEGLSPSTLFQSRENTKATKEQSLYMQRHLRRQSSWFLVFSVMLIFASNLSWAAVGIVTGTVIDPSGAVVPNATVTITSVALGYQRRTSSDGQGHFVFSNVPFSQYTVSAEARGFEPVVDSGQLRSSLPTFHQLQFRITASEQVTVSAKSPLLEPSTTLTHRELEANDIRHMSLVQPQRAMSEVVLSIPGVVQEENGRLHVRGSESQVQYVVDGVPISENLSNTFGVALDPNDLRSSDLVTGNIPAEFGGRLSAVVNVNTKSGLEKPWSGNLSLFGGSFDTGGSGAEIAGHFKKLGVFLNADVSRSRRFLDPPEVENFHNSGGVAHLFNRFDFAPSKNDSVRLNLSTNGSNFQVPNLFEQQFAGQRQRRELRDDSESLGWTHVFNPDTLSDIVLFRGSATARLLDSDQTGFPLFATQTDRTRTEGVRASLTHEWHGHTFKAGFQVHRLTLDERLSLAATDPEDLEEEDDPLSQFPISNPFVFQEAHTGNESALFLEDRIRLRKFTVDLGLRFDHYDLVAHNNSGAPRVGVAYYIERTGTVLRASYNRLFETPPIENLLLASSLQASVFAPEARLTPVPPQWQNTYEFGFQQQLGKRVRLDVSHFIKNIRNFADDEQFLDSGIVFPVSIARGDVRGTEARLDVNTFRGVSGYLSYGNLKATGTTPLVGGLPIGEGEQLLPNTKFAADQDERNEGQFGILYSHQSGAWVTFSGRYDSGVPSDFDDDDFPAFDARIQKQLDPVKHRIKPRAIFNTTLGVDLFRESKHPVSLQIGANNLFDRFYLYNFRSIFSGTHVGRPREVLMRLVFHWKDND
jgi:outer membrane cobalamin receptor